MGRHKRLAIDACCDWLIGFLSGIVTCSEVAYQSTSVHRSIKRDNSSKPISALRSTLNHCEIWESNLLIQLYCSESVKMASNVKNDEEDQLFFDQNMLRETGAQTTLKVVVDSKSFADSEADYFVGKGGLAGIIGVPPAPFDGFSAYVDERWTLLRRKAGLQETQKEGSQPLFCWVDSVHPVIAAEAQKGGWLKVDDVVGLLSPEPKDGNPLCPGVPQAGLALLLKICGALADMSYPPEVVDRVSALVKRNLMTAVHSELDTQCSPGDEEWIKLRVAAVLACMLDSNTSRTPSINVNSNEPVLLINNFGELNHELVRKIVGMTMEQLHQVWNVWPVRVYAGPFIMGQVSDEYRQIGFSITLLNVVNTDIGGPSASLSYFHRICPKMTGVRFHKIESVTPVVLISKPTPHPHFEHTSSSELTLLGVSGSRIHRVTTVNGRLAGLRPVVSDF